MDLMSKDHEAGMKRRPTFEHAMVFDILNHASDPSIYEPTRFVRDAYLVPPQRFYRTVWRSMARKMLALKNMNT